MINSSLKIKWKEEFQSLPGPGYEAYVPLPLAESWAGEQRCTLLYIYHNQDVSSLFTLYTTKVSDSFGW